MHKFEDLKLWKTAIDIATKVYYATSKFPREEIYGLTAQIRRSAVSVPSNIAEGAGRNTNRDFKHFLAISNGSSYELQTQIFIAQKLAIMDSVIADDLFKALNELQKMNFGLQKSLSRSE